MEKRYYYKDKNGCLMNLKSPKNDPALIEITEQEFNQLSKPKKLTVEQKVLIEKRQFIAQKKALLIKYREDVEQVDLFGMQRDDYEEKKALCRQLVLELRELERELNS